MDLHMIRYDTIRFGFGLKICLYSRSWRELAAPKVSSSTLPYRLPLFFPSFHPNFPSPSRSTPSNPFHTLPKLAVCYTNEYTATPLPHPLVLRQKERSSLMIVLSFSFFSFFAFVFDFIRLSIVLDRHRHNTPTSSPPDVSTSSPYLHHPTLTLPPYITLDP